MCAIEDAPTLQLKTRSSGITVSDFTEQHCGFLRLTDSKLDVARADEPEFQISASVV